MTTDTQREPKPGEWWEMRDGQPVLVRCIGHNGPHDHTDYGVLNERGIAWWVNRDAMTRFTGKAIDLTPPAPPAKKLRAWTFEEACAHFGSLFRRINDTSVFRLQAVRVRALEFFTWTVPYDAALEGWQHSTDSGRTWQPCGVEE